MKINVIVIGYGSIGQRHVRILNDLKHRVAVVSRRNINYPIRYSTIEHAVECEQPEYIVLANETSEHENTLIQLKNINYDKKILVEKPLFHEKNKEFFSFSKLYVGYNLRFHPIIKAIKEKLDGQQIFSVQVYVGQYLPSWRPNINYAESYSAKSTKGGGVIRDLSHELDYLQYLFGDWNSLVACGGTYSNLLIDSDDVFSLIYKTDRAPIINIQMNYLDHIIQRFVIINTSKTTYKLDFIKNALYIGDEQIKFETRRDETYVNQHQAIIGNQHNHLCSYEEGNRIVKLIEKAEQSSREKRWINNE